jgi:reverse transcriptase-like protein
VLAAVRCYRPDAIFSFLGPKPRGGWRRFAVLSPRDQRTWKALAGRVARRLEPRLDDRVAANRTVGAPNNWRLETTEAAFRRARAIAPKRGLLMRTDVEEFYPSVTPQVLSRALDEVGAPPEDAHLAEGMLESWCTDGYPGLPVGPVGSAVLANAVLKSVDEALSSLRFVRWVDDYVIALPSDRAASEILERLDTSLDRLGLRRSGPKTGVFEGLGGVAWLQRGPARVASPTSPSR